MDSIQTFNCPSCQAVNNQGDSECSKCRESLTIATLKSIGTGNVPEDFVWPIFPYDMSIGSSTSNDIVIQNRAALVSQVYNQVKGYLKH